MAEKIIIAEVDIDLDKAVKNIQDLKEATAAAKLAADNLKKSAGETSAEFIQANAVYKANAAELRTQENLLQKVTYANKSGADSREQLAAQYAVITNRLNKMSEEERLNTTQGKAWTDAAKLLKEQIITLDKSIGNTASSVGNYREEIDAALKGQQAFSGGTTNVINNFIEISQQEGGVKSFFGTVANGLKGATKAALTFIATPIGAVIAAVVVGIGLITAAINGNQASADKFSKVWAGISAVIDVLTGNVVKLGVALIDALSKPKQLISDLGQFLEDQLINRFKGFVKMGSALLEMFTNPKKGLKDLADAALQAGTGVENIRDKFKKFGEDASKAFSEAYNAGQKLKQMQNDLRDAQTAAIITFAELSAKMEKFNIASGDNTRSLKSQQAATIELGRIQKQQAQLSLKLTEQELAAKVAEFELKKKNNGGILADDEKTLNELKAKRIESVSALQGIELENAKRIREIKQDQLQRELDLLVDGYDSYKTLNEKKVNNDKLTNEERQAALDDLKIRQDKVFLDEAAAIAKFHNTKIDLNKLSEISDAKLLAAEVANMNISDVNAGRILEMIKERRAAQGDFADAQISLNEAVANNAVEQMNLEILKFQESYKEKNRIVGDGLAFDLNIQQQRFNNEIEFQKQLAKKQQDELKFQLKNKLITQAQYDTQLFQSQSALNQTLFDLNKNFEESEKARKLEVAKTNYDNDLELAKENIFAQLDLQKQNNDIKLKEELKAAEKIGADKSKIEAKYRKADLALEKAKTDAKLALAAGFAGNLATIFGEGTKIGKAAAVVQTTISTYQAATGAYAAMASIPYVGPALGIAAAAAAVASGIANVKKILAVKTDVSSASSSVDTSTSSTPSATSSLVSANANIGAGIVSRDTVVSNQSQQQIQPVLVVDDVTAKQMNNTNKVKTSNL